MGFDSMGTRGMATVIDTGSLKIFLDAGVSLAPRRYGLPPHPLEEERLRMFLDMIYEELGDTDIIVISHYHRDHYLYRSGEEEYYRGRTLYVKDPSSMINNSQRIRSYILLEKMNVKSIARKVLSADNKSFIIDKGIRLVFSKPYPHGAPGTPLGYVLMTLIDIDGYKILHASDVQGPVDDEAYSFIVENKPDILIISGPPIYLGGYRVEAGVIEKGLRNLERIVLNIGDGATIIVDHHMLRDLGYTNFLNPLKELGEERGVRVMTAAEYMGMENELLEALRKKLWGRRIGEASDNYRAFRRRV